MEEKNQENKTKNQVQEQAQKVETKKVEQTTKTQANNKEGFKKVDNTVKSQGKSKTNNKEKRNSIKSSYILGIVILLVVLILILVIVFMMQNKPEKTLNDMFSALKAGDFAKVQEYVNYNEVIDSSQLIDGENMNVDAQKLLFDKLEWNIKNVNTENDKATIEVEVTNKDLKTVIGNYMQKALQDLFSGQNIEDTDVENYIVEELKSEDVQMTTITKNIELTKQDDNWKVTANDELIDAILPGLRETMQSLNSISD